MLSLSNLYNFHECYCTTMCSVTLASFFHPCLQSFGVGHPCLKYSLNTTFRSVLAHTMSLATASNRLFFGLSLLLQSCSRPLSSSPIHLRCSTNKLFSFSSWSCLFRSPVYRSDKNSVSLRLRKTCLFSPVGILLSPEALHCFNLAYLIPYALG